MTDLIAFITARLDEDERKALDVWPHVRSWETAGGWPEHYPTKVVSGDVLIVEDDADMATVVMPHIARHAPARVLREVQAHRELLLYCSGELADDETVEMPRFLLAHLAAVWSDHPEYRQEEWAP